MLRRGALGIVAAVCLAACPTSRANNAGEASVDTGIGDVPADEDVGDGMDSEDVRGGDVHDESDAGIAPPDVGIRMVFTFTSASFNGSAGGMSLRANMVWHGNLRGDAGGIQFKGDFR